MRNLFLLGTALAIATNVWAFGGIGLGPLQRHKSSGVDAIGVHIDANGDNTTPDITFVEPECNTDEDCDIYAQKCVNGTCESVCDAGLYMGDNDGNPYCYPVPNGNCNTNANCNVGEYCEIAGDMDNNIPTSGTCQLVANNSLPISWHEQSLVRSKEGISWWSADNFCRAQGKHLVHFRELGMSRPEGWCDGTEENCAGLTSEEWANLITSLQVNEELTACGGVWVNEGNDPGSAYYIEPGDGAAGDADMRPSTNSCALCK